MATIVGLGATAGTAMALPRRTLNRIATTSVRSGILARGVGIGVALLAAGAGLAYVMQLCLARWLGATAYGTYTYVIAWSGLLAIAAGMGFPGLLESMINLALQKWNVGRRRHTRSPGRLTAARE